MADDNGPLSVDQAVSLLDSQGAPEPEAAPVQPEPAAAPEGGEAEPQAEPVEAGPVEQEPEPPRAPPSHWNAEERAIFAELPVKAQDALLAQEGKREAIVQRAKQAAEQERQAAANDRAAANLRVQALDQLLPQALNTFQNRWAHVDWTTLPDQVGAETAFKMKAAFDAEQQQLQRLHAAQQQAMSDAQRQFVQQETEALRTVAPDLVDQKEGQARRAQLGQFLVAEGFPADRIAQMSAKEASIAYDAMRWREAQKRAAAPKTKPAPAQAQQRQAPAGVRPSAAAGQRQPQSTADAAMARLRKTGRIDDAVAVLNARTPA